MLLKTMSSKPGIHGLDALGMRRDEFIYLVLRKVLSITVVERVAEAMSNKLPHRMRDEDQPNFVKMLLQQWEV